VERIQAAGVGEHGGLLGGPSSFFVRDSTTIFGQWL
jgi:hypothetical protein